MPPKNTQRPNAIDEDEELDTQIDPEEEEDVPREEEGEPPKKGNDKGKGKANKGKGRQVPDQEEDDDDDERLKAAVEENRALHEELAQIRTLFEQHRRDTDRAARLSATAGASSSNANTRDQSSNTASSSSNARRQPLNAATPGDPNSPDNNHQGNNNGSNNESEKRIPMPAKKDTLTIKVIQDHLGLTDSREDHLLWLEWRENIRSWSSMANLDYDLTWKLQDKGRVGALVTMIRDRIPQFRRFVSNWAAEFLVQDYFNHRRGHRMSKAMDDDSSPPKKKRRGNTTKTSQNQTEGSSKQANATPEHEDRARRTSRRPIPRPPPPTEDDEARNDGAAADEDDDFHNNARNDPPATSSSKNKRGGDTGASSSRNRVPLQGCGSATSRGGGPRRGGGPGRGTAQGRGLNIQVNAGPPPSMSTRSRTRVDKAPNSTHPEDTDGEPEGDSNE